MKVKIAVSQYLLSFLETNAFSSNTANCGLCDSFFQEMCRLRPRLSETVYINRSKEIPIAVGKCSFCERFLAEWISETKYGSVGSAVRNLDVE